MRRASKRDENEEMIVKALRRCGASVYHLADKGIPDLLVGWCGKMFLLEVKGEKGRLTKAQKDFRASWKGPKSIIVKDMVGALAAIGALQTREIDLSATTTAACTGHLVHDEYVSCPVHDRGGG